MAVAYIKTGMFNDDRNVGIPHGGMGGITQAMARAAQSRGVEIRTGAEIDRITVSNGRATGVLLQSGEHLQADVVLSNADPKRTFLSLVEPEALEPAFVSRVRRLKTNVSYLKFHCALSEVPDFSAHLGDGFDPRYLAQTRICPSIDYFERSWDEARRGLPPTAPVMHIQIPSVYDTSLTPPGKHVMSIWALYAPVTLAEGCWDDERQATGERMIDIIDGYAPTSATPSSTGALHAPGPGAPRRPHRRQHPSPRRNLRAASHPAPQPPSLRLRHPHRRPLPLRRRHPPGGEVTGAPATTPPWPSSATGNSAPAKSLSDSLFPLRGGRDCPELVEGSGWG